MLLNRANSNLFCRAGVGGERHGLMIRVPSEPAPVTSADGGRGKGAKIRLETEGSSCL